MRNKIIILVIMMLFSVSFVNAQNRPTGADKTVSTNEDVDKVFASSDFSYSDADGDAFYRIRITSDVSTGTLYLDANLNGVIDGGETLSNWDYVLVSDFNKFKFKPQADQNGNGYDNFDFKVDDNNDGLSSFSYTITIDVAPVNDDPVITTNTGITVSEGSTGNAIAQSDLETTDIEQSASSLTYTVTTKPAHGTLKLNGIALDNNDTYTQQDINSNRIKYDNDGSENATDSYSFSVDDGAGGSVAGVFNINITPVNDAPVLATNTGKTVNEASINNVILQSELEVTDVDNTTAQITYTVTVVPVNGVLKLSGSALSAGQTFTQADINSNNLTYSHDGSETVSDLFKFTVSDGSGGNIAETTFNITVNAVNDPPVITTNSTLTVSEAGNGTITNAFLETSDNDNTPAQLTYTVSTKPAHGTLRRNATVINNGGTFTQDDIDNNRITYTHDGSETTTDNFTFSVSDGTDNTASTVFNITITPVNDAPVLATNTGKTVNEASVNNVILQGELETTDEDNTAAQLIYTITVIPINGVLKLSGSTLSAGQTLSQADINANHLTYSHDGSETNSDLFKFTVSDGNGGNIAETTFNITVNATNDAPVIATNNTLTVNEAGNGTITNAFLQTTDNDNTPAQLTYTVSSTTTNGTLRRNATVINNGGTFTQDDIDNNRITYTHDGTETTTDHFTFSVSDGTDNTSSTTFNITITPVNDAPVLVTNTGKTVNEASTNNVILQGELETTDDDNTAAQLIYTITVIPTNGVLKLSGSTLSAGQTLSQADINANNLTYSHDGSETNSDLFKFTVSDGNGGSVPETTFNITVNAVNDPPVVSKNNTLTVNEAGSGTITNAFLQTTDNDNTPAQLTYTVSSTTSNGTLYKNATVINNGGTFTQDDIDNNRITYTHDGTETTTDNFTFTVSDGTDNTVATTFNITITPVNDDPTLITNTGITVDENSVNNAIAQANLEVTDDDNTAGELTYTVTVIPSNGDLKLSGTTLSVGSTFTQADINSNHLSYSHDGSETNSDLFKFTVSDGNGGNIAETTFNITVNPINDIPYFTTTPSTVADEGILYTYNIGAADDDNPGNQLSFNATTIPAWLSLTDNGDGTATLSGTPPHGVARNNPVTLVVTDGTDSETQSFVIVVSLDIIVPGDYPTIQQAIDASVNGDVISVQAGTYNETIDFKGKDIEVIGVEADPTQVIIDGTSLTGSVVSFVSGEPSTAILSGVTVQNGTGRLGMVSSTNFHAPASGYYGGGVFVYGSNPTLKNIIIKDNSLQTNNNHGGSGAGLYIASGSDVHITGDISTCTIKDNTSSVYRGGGICVDDATLTFDNVDVINNTAGNYGGGVALYNSTFDYSNSSISGNSTSGRNGTGGGLFSINSTIINGGGNAISGNSASVSNNNQYVYP